MLVSTPWAPGTELRDAVQDTDPAPRIFFYRRRGFGDAAEGFGAFWGMASFFFLVCVRVFFGSFAFGEAVGNRPKQKRYTSGRNEEMGRRMGWSECVYFSGLPPYVFGSLPAIRFVRFCSWFGGIFHPTLSTLFGCLKGNRKEHQPDMGVRLLQNDKHRKLKSKNMRGHQFPLDNLRSGGWHRSLTNLSLFNSCTHISPRQC